MKEVFPLDLLPNMDVNAKIVWKLENLKIFMSESNNLSISQFQLQKIKLIISPSINISELKLIPLYKSNYLKISTKKNDIMTTKSACVLL